MKHKGFTLIELLVVIAIIGILATVVITSLSSARSKARDARRLQDIKQIQTALEVYYLENGRYPTGTGGVAPNNSWTNSGNSSWETLESVLGVTLPRDPINDVPVTSVDWAAGSNKRFNYAYIRSIGGCPTGQSYMMVYRLEKGDTSPAESPGIVRCDNGNTDKYGNGSITVGVTPMM